MEEGGMSALSVFERIHRAELNERRARNYAGQVAQENVRLRAALRIARDELAKWGWGDLHYGAQPQDQSVKDALAVVDGALAATAPPDAS